MTRCKRPGCERPVDSRGLCKGHWRQLFECYPTECEACGKTYFTTRRNGRACSLECRWFISPQTVKSLPIPWAECRLCGRWFVTHARRRYCEPCRGRGVKAVRQRAYSARCRIQRRHDGLARKGRPMVFPCQECGATIDTRGPDDRRRLFCSPGCGRRFHKRLRRARLKGARVERVGLAEIAERDGWRCHLCRRRVRPSQATLDHLIPLARGGDHSEANVALAHWVCNVRRGVDRHPAQLRLPA